MSSPLIAVIGGDPCSEKEGQDAREVGERIALCGAILLTGGLGGVMEFASEGAARAGGITVGILPGDDPSSANAHVTIPICTSLGHLRNTLVVSAGQAVIAIGGRIGTLSEIAFARLSGKRVIGLGSWRLDEGRLPEDVVFPASSPEEAVALALREAKR
ncbi:MAG: TIGR00725 family protein [Planctomycetota bacterium]|nr:TIGR00725 family protein [Planctomycetota bacterium]